MAPKQFPVVGIGASADGLQALEMLFRSMPIHTGLAFVVVAHIAWSHESTLAEIIGRYTTMPVADALDGQPIEPNHVYVAPTAYIVTVKDRQLQLTPRSSEAQRKPIDLFLSSLAEAYGELAVGIILSGSGNDGTLGVKAIKERGGFTMAQGTDGSAPQYQGMPVEVMAQRLVTFAQSSHNDVERLGQELRNTRERLLSTIEEYETVVEELKSSNEALCTVNAELNSKVEELDRSNNDLRNVFESTQVGTVFLDQNLSIRSFTPAIASIFNLSSSDRGRPLTDIISHVDNPELLREIQMVLERGELLEKNVRSLDGRTHYLVVPEEPIKTGK